MNKIGDLVLINNIAINDSLMYLNGTTATIGSINYYTNTPVSYRLKNLKLKDHKQKYIGFSIVFTRSEFVNITGMDLDMIDLLYGVDNETI